MKTSKIKTIAECKPWTGEKGTVYYHNLAMENGDKINIGKKKELSVGEELHYEIIGDIGQHEYTKAKSVNPQFQKKNDDYVKGIEVGHAINNAVNMVCAGVDLLPGEEFKTEAHKIYKFAEKVLQISDELKARR